MQNRRILGAAALCLAALGLITCDSGDAVVKTCDLQAGPNSKDVPLTVEYEYALTGARHGTFIEIAYRTNEGPKTVVNAGEVASETISEFIERGNPIEIGASAQVARGGARVGYTARDSVGTVVLEESDQCDAN